MPPISPLIFPHLPHLPPSPPPSHAPHPPPRQRRCSFIDGQEVLLLHQMTLPEPDCWDLPGGGLDPAEDLITGLRREVAEEIGITNFTIEQLLTVFEGFYPEPGGQLHTLNLVYQCRVSPRPLTFTPVDLEEIGPQGIRWLPAQELTPEQCSDRAWAAIAAAGLV
ncbi:MAG: NUDIX hydrolase [Leptolyngbyaceae cyanobacterium SM2_5_2]|nr:NUDIX hydrolase [Leptolyngbyaceae cyanobacterium SM2_5_2]